MPESILRIHACSFDTRPCDNYTCRQALGKKKFFIGNPFAHGHKAIFCEDCIRDLVQNVPAELLEGGADLEARLREEIAAELEVKIREELKAELQRVSIELKAQLDAEAQAAAEADEAAKQEELAAASSAPDEEPEEENKPLYRCLDCGEEFDTPQKLGSHRRKHKD